MPGVHGGLLLNPNGNNEWKKHVRLFDLFVIVNRVDCLFGFQMVRYSIGVEGPSIVKRDFNSSTNYM